MIGSAASTFAAEPTLRKVRDLVIYQDATIYSAFPSVVRRPDGELLVAFRRAPSRRALGEKSESHTDPTSQLVLVRSRDGGDTWSKTPELIYAHAFGGSQDPCLLQLRDGTLLCASYGWMFLNAEGSASRLTPNHQSKPGVHFLGGYLVRSIDGAKSWQGPITPPHVEAEVNLDPYGRPLPAYNRGAMTEGAGGRLFWAVAANDQSTPRKSSTHLLVSDDRGSKWRYSAPVAVDAKVTFNDHRGTIPAIVQVRRFACGEIHCLCDSRFGIHSTVLAVT